MQVQQHEVDSASAECSFGLHPGMGDRGYGKPGDPFYISLMGSCCDRFVLDDQHVDHRGPPAGAL